MSINSQAEFREMQEISQIVAQTLKQMRAYTEVGMSTKEIDEFGGRLLKQFGATSAPMKDYDFPGFTCICVNHEVCHGIPKASTIIKEGDLVNIDVSAELNGYYSDNGGSFIVGEDLQNLQPLVDASKEILHAAIARIAHDVRINKVGGFIHNEAKKFGYDVIRNLSGHGVGRKLHEEPFEVANFKNWRVRGKFKKNMVIAIETFISTGATYVYEAADGWTMYGDDGGFVVQHEHTVLVREGREPVVFTRMNGV